MAEVEITYPQEHQISEDVIMRVGFKDDRIEIKVFVLIAWRTLKIPVADKDKILKAFGLHDEWMKLPDFVRKHVGAP